MFTFGFAPGVDCSYAKVSNLSVTVKDVRGNLAGSSTEQEMKPRDDERALIGG